MGWENVFHCEWNPFGQKVLKHYWPKSISYADICSTDFSIHRGYIDIISGGFPCQPYSAAGKRLGKEDDRHLWPEMLRAINEIQPRWVVGENVFGLVNWSGGLVFDEVQTDLEAAGYEVFPYVLPAAAVGAPHRRDRTWFVAHDIGSSEGGNKFRCVRFEDAEVSRQGSQTIHDAIGSNGFEGIAADTTGEQGERVRPKFRESCEQEQEQFGGNGSDVGSERDVANINRDGLNQRNCKHEKQSSEGRFNAFGNTYEGDGDGNAADTGDTGLQGGEIFGGTGSSGSHDNKFATGCVPPNWDKFPTQSPICVRNDGISTELDTITFSKWRNESIKAAGNAIVPQVVHQIFKAIEQYENLP